MGAALTVGLAAGAAVAVGVVALASRRRSAVDPATAAMLATYRRAVTEGLMDAEVSRPTVALADVSEARGYFARAMRAGVGATDIATHRRPGREEPAVALDILPGGAVAIARGAAHYEAAKAAGARAVLADATLVGARGVVDRREVVVKLR